LEYEEKVSIHGQIAAYLKQKLDTTKDGNLKNELAPYVAAHSLVSGDDETAKQMLVISAQAANEIEGNEIVEQAFATYQNISGTKDESEDVADRIIFQELLNQPAGRTMATDIPGDRGNQYSGEDEAYPIDFSYIRRTIVDEYHKEHYEKAVKLVDTYISTHKKTLKPSEISQLLSIAARCYVELGDLEASKDYLEKAISELENYKEPIPEAFVLNVGAIINLEEGKIDEAYAALKKAAKKSMYLPPEIKLITIANIALVLKKDDPKQAEKYFYILRRLTKQLNYEELAEDIFD
jgi:tetratricopeptide (TPR) repeat protein